MPAPQSPLLPEPSLEMRAHYADKYSDLSDIANTVLAQNAKDIGDFAFALAAPAAQQMTDNERGITKVIRKLQRQARGVLQANQRDLAQFNAAAGPAAMQDVYICDAVDAVGNSNLTCVHVSAGDPPIPCPNPIFIGRMPLQEAEDYCANYAAQAQAPPVAVPPPAALGPGAPPISLPFPEARPSQHGVPCGPRRDCIRLPARFSVWSVP